MQSYYVDQVINDVIADLMEEYGYSETAATHLVYSGGYKIYANVDLSVQAVLDEVYQDAASFPDTESAGFAVRHGHHGPVYRARARHGRRRRGKDGQPRVEPRDDDKARARFLHQTADGLRARTGYGLISPASVFDDSPFIEETAWPKNQSRGYTGRMTVKRAVQNSTNTVAVKVLDLVTPERSFTFATVNLGLDLVRSEEINGKVFSDVDYAPLALGGPDKRPVRAGYDGGVLYVPEPGIYAEPTTYSKVVDSNGKPSFQTTRTIPWR